MIAMSRYVTVKLSDELIVKIDCMAAARGWSRSKLIRYALRRYIARIEGGDC